MHSVMSSKNKLLLFIGRKLLFGQRLPKNPLQLGFKYMYLAKTKGQRISIFSTYILFLTEMQKRQISENGFALLKNDITTF